MSDSRHPPMVPRRRLIVGGAAFVIAGSALALANELRPVADVRTISAYVAAATAVPDRLAICSILYFVAALFLLPGPLALGGWASTRGASVIYIGSLMTLIGALWFVVEGLGMVVLTGLALAPAQATPILERINQGGGPVVICLFVFMFSPLVLGIGFRRANLAGSWLVALWVIAFLVSFAAESQLGADIPAIRTLNSALLGLLVAAVGVVTIRAAIGQESGRSAMGVTPRDTRGLAQGAIGEQ